MTLDQLSSEWAIHVFYLLVQADLLALVTILFVGLAKRVPARVRYALLLVALSKFVIPPMLPSPTGLFSAGREVAGPLFRPVELTIASGTSVSDLLALLFAVHLCGIAVMTMRLVVGVSRRDAIRARAAAPDADTLEDFVILCDQLRVRRRPALLVSGEIAVPIAFGVARPVVMIPSRLVDEMSRESVSLILAHELAHIRRGDLWANFAETAIRMLWWFDPCLRALLRSIGRVREECCDDEVLAHFAGRARQYSTALVDAVEVASDTRLSAALALGTSEGGSLAGRLRRMAEVGFRPGASRSKLEVVIVGVAVLLLLPGLGPVTASQPAQAPERVLTHFGLGHGAHQHNHSHP